MSLVVSSMDNLSDIWELFLVMEDIEVQVHVRIVLQTTCNCCCSFINNKIFSMFSGIPRNMQLSAMPSVIIVGMRATQEKNSIINSYWVTHI